MKKPVNMKKFLILNVPYVFLGLFFTKIGQAWRLAQGTDLSGKMLHIPEGFKMAFQSFLPSFHPVDILVGIAFALIIRLIVYVRGKNAKKFRKNEEYGSARWGTQEDIAPYVDPVFKNNIILTQTERLMMSNRPKDPRNARNKNVLVIGGSGSGKTRFFIKPNLMQMHSSYVVTDPKGTVLVECGKLLQKNGYRIKVFNTINFKKSMHYNPFAYIHSEKDILKLVTTLIANTKGDGKGGDDFWQKAETLLYTAIIGYIHYEAPVEEQNFSTLIEFINAMEVREDDETFENNVDLLFKELEEKDPNHFAVRQYKKYKLAAGKTAKSINISCGARLAPFDIQELREITSYDELELDTLGDRIYDSPDADKDDYHMTALFLIMSDTDTTFNFLISMIYSQLFNLLCEKADDFYGGRLPVHVRCLIDECANIGQIPNLEKLMATIRSREISACLVLQAQSQLKALYKDSADTIIGNCDCSIFLGGKEPTTLKELNQSLGKETIDTYNTGESRGREVSHSLNYQKLGKDLASVDELAVLDGGKCILQLRGVRPFMSSKYDITQHPNYRYLSDYNDKNKFDIEKYLSTQLKPKPDEKYDTYEVSVENDDDAVDALPVSAFS
ncbi:MAG: type IV secretory system conjugative DNA transfer family protein [Oscillospiraceae bacterium]|nr:type IV secretory system conjugative DNA transfer family protein [Oscillospiraceae bacterium]